MSAAASSPAHVRAPTIVPALLAFIAGAVDACTFLALFGFFVAQLTGSFVTVGIQIITHDQSFLIHLLALPLFFVAGVAIVVLVQLAGNRALALALAIETALLAGLMATGLAATPFRQPNGATAVLASALGLLAMGVQSATVRLMLPGAASTNVMTINTTQLAIDVAQWLIAGYRSSTDAASAAAGRIAVLGPIMAGFFAGTVCGAIGFTWLGFWSLLPLMGILAGLVWWAIRRL